MSGPIFQLGDEVVWRGESPDPAYEHGSFVVVTTLRNNPRQRYACTLPRLKFGNQPIVEAPVQWITVREKGNQLPLFWGITVAELRKGRLPKSIKFDSRWFRKVS